MAVEDGVPKGMVLLVPEEWHTRTHVRLVCVSMTDDIPCGWHSSLVPAEDESIADAEGRAHIEKTRENTRDAAGNFTGTTLTHIYVSKYYRLG